MKKIIIILSEYSADYYFHLDYSSELSHNKPLVN